MSYDMAIWEMIRASGIVAYVLLSVSVAAGMAVRLRALDWLMRRPWVLEAHQAISILALAFTGLHMLVLLLGRHVPFTVGDVLIPLSADWDPLAMAAGVLSCYLVAIVLASSCARALIGYRTWRAIHFGGFGAWALALGHSVAAGSDTGELWVQYVYLLSAAVVGILMLIRVLGQTSERSPAPAASSSEPCRDEMAPAD